MGRLFSGSERTFRGSGHLRLVRSLRQTVGSFRSFQANHIEGIESKSIANKPQRNE